ncbi:RNA polymerase sigma factor [Microbacterium karelineae]|uniref:RNA polymerase sigma factor n=1 Tax=Microbacterium karelineae TaxID=2654283 RepID=UPI0012E9BDE2|nr:sigma-70 family RNA polymerase sigma factor [Microbacterium karelineae]
MDPETPGEERARSAVAAVDRAAQARIVAALARRFGDLDLAEDMLQEAVERALRRWPVSGIPDSPAAWLTTAATRAALDILRRDAVRARKLAQLGADAERAPAPRVAADPAGIVADRDEEAIGDDRLGLFFACAHPLLAPEDRIALTLRFLAGLATVDVAHALLVPVATMQQRITRAKKRIRQLGVRFGAPGAGDVRERLPVVQRVVYLLYAEGFARSSGVEHISDDLTSEAIRLARLLCELMPGSAEARGLLALLLLTEARRPARADARGRPIPLAEQDRSLWRDDLVADGLRLAESAAASPRAGAYAIQAAIAAVHAEAETYEETDWAQIAVLYRLLSAYDGGPVVRLGGAVAHGRARGLEEGIRRLDELSGDPALVRFRPFHIARAVTLEELGRRDEAAGAYRTALALPGNDAEDAFLAASLAGLDGDG